MINDFTPSADRQRHDAAMRRSPSLVTAGKDRHPLRGGEGALALAIALMAGNMGASHVRRYGQRPDDTPRHILTGTHLGRSTADLIRATAEGGAK